MRRIPSQQLWNDTESVQVRRNGSQGYQGTVTPLQSKEIRKNPTREEVRDRAHVG